MERGVLSVVDLISVNGCRMVPLRQRLEFGLRLRQRCGVRGVW